MPLSVAIKDPAVERNETMHSHEEQGMEKDIGARSSAQCRLNSTEIQMVYKAWTF
jgi:hypothetical protein